MGNHLRRWLSLASAVVPLIFCTPAAADSGLWTLFNGGTVPIISCPSHQWIVSITDLNVATCVQPSYADVSGTVPAAAIPAPTATTLGGIESLAATSSKWINAISTSGVPSATQPACGDLSNAAASCSIDATVATNISSGTLPNARIVSLPNANLANSAITINGTAVALGGTRTLTLASADFANQGTTTTVLHGNASGIPSFAAVSNADLANSAITINGTSVSLGGSRSLALNSADFANEGTTTTVLHGNASGNPSFAAIANADLTNSSITVAGHSVALGASTSVACADLSNGATGCSTATGTSGATLPLLNGTNTWSGAQSFNSSDFILKGATSGTLTFNCAAVCASSVVTWPSGTTDFSSTGGASQFLKQASAGAAITVARPACADLSNAAASCSTDTTVATNISSGTLPAARLPNPSATTLGGIESFVAVSNQWINTISTSGVPSASQPACANLSNAAASCSTDATVATNITSGTLPNARISALPLSALATQTADTVVANASGSTAAPTAVSIGSCSTTSSSLTYNTTTHAYGCNGLIASTTALTLEHLLGNTTVPTIGACGGGSPSISAHNGTMAIRVTIGTSIGTCVVNFPAATTGWNCTGNDITTTSATVFYTKQTASSTTSATMANFTTAAVAGNWTNGDVLQLTCHAY